MPRRSLEWSVWRQLQERHAAGADANVEWHKTYANIPSTCLAKISHRATVSPYLVFYQFLERDLLVLLLLLLLVFFQHKARGQRVSVHAAVRSARTDPEPAVLIILNGVQEMLAHLQNDTAANTRKGYEARWFPSNTHVHPKNLNVHHPHSIWLFLFARYSSTGNTYNMRLGLLRLCFSVLLVDHLLQLLLIPVIHSV